MFKLSIALVVGIFTWLQVTDAQAAPLRFTVKSPNRYLKVEVVDDNLVHFETGEGAPPTETDAIATSPQVFDTSVAESHAVRVSQYVINTLQSSFEIDPQNLCVTISDMAQNTKLSVLCPQNGNGNLQLSMTQEKMISVYGLGEKFRKPGEPNGDWLGDERPPGVYDGNMMTGFDGNYTADMEIPVMYALGPHNLNYALFVDHVRSQIWNFKQDPWTMKAEGPTLRFYVITGQDLPHLRQKFVSLVGRPPIPPKKAFGLWVSQYGFKRWTEIEDRLSILRSKKFPVDGFVMDLDWFGGISERSPDTHMGKLTWNRNVFNDPEGHLARYRNADGIGLILIEEPYVGQNLAEFTLLQNQNTLALSALTGMPAIFSSWFGQGGMVDWTNDGGAAWWHDTKRQPLIDMGVFGHWTDLGEPSELVSGMKYHGVEGVEGDDASHLHNLFNFKWHESIAQGYLRNHVAQRPFMISRTGTTGIERFGGALWSGDIAARITSLAAHLNAQMHLSFSGIDYFGADIGGFYRVEHDGEPHQTYTRWFAHGAAFDVPVRPHACIFTAADKTSPAEEGSTASNLSNLRQRYELIPYYYSLAYRAYKFGEPVFPPPIYYFQNDAHLKSLGAEKMIGPYMLVATEASQAFTTNVYLPEGEWTDFLTDKKYLAPKLGLTLNNFPLIRGGLFKLPTFVRAGAILPRALVDDKTMNALGKRLDGSRDDALRLQIFPAQLKSRFAVYEDDGETVGYKNGASAVTEISQWQNGGRLEIEIASASGTYLNQKNRQNLIEVILPENGQVHKVALNGKPLPHARSVPFSRANGWALTGGHHLIIKSGPISVNERKHFIID